MNLRSYPVTKPSTFLSTGKEFYHHLMVNRKVAAEANHIIWYNGAQQQLQEKQKFAFRGALPVGQKLDLVSIGGQLNDLDLLKRIQHSGSPYFEYEVTGEEDYLCVADLSDATKIQLNIPDGVKPTDKVFNRNFVNYEELPTTTKYSNELASMALPKAFSSWYAGNIGKTNYSEVDVLNYVKTCFENLSGPEMLHLLQTNNALWTALAYVRSKGSVESDVMVEFHGQNPADFYYKDMGTVVPMLFYGLALLGEDPVKYAEQLDKDIYIWGASDAAKYMTQFMPK